MAQRTVWLPEIGELTLSKRRGSRNIRISVSAAGRVRVGLPTWLPYSAGISFALSRKEWLLEHKAKHQTVHFKDGDRIGKSFRLRYQYDPAVTKTSARVLGADVIVKSNMALSDDAVQEKASLAAERALKKEAEKLLPPRLQELASQYGFSYNSLSIKKMSSRWGSCSSQQNISLNFFLMQLPWQLIDYVILHELVHTKHLNHSDSFWRELVSVYPKAQSVRKEIYSYRPVINSVGLNMA